MKFDARKGDTGLVYDANSVLIPWPIAGDTETGEVEVQVRDDTGRLILDTSKEVSTETRHYVPPLRVEPIPPGWVNPYAPIG